MQKYKACCDRRCLLSVCIVRDNGGCSCACNMVDCIDELKDIQKGDRFPGIYIHDKYEANIYYEKNKEFIEKYKTSIPNQLLKIEKILQEKYLYCN